ncbi:MAG: DNA repair protein RecN [Bacteroidales bacterium]|jgi:DNA repair protein RecN (Recombination protein N)|nr:DNA repair protein RecN [Bacteroidales bacterium]
MLKSLTINNYALIDKLNIDFNQGLTIITGETGAGKSILLGALSLILGQRADSAVLRDKDNKCIVEAEFDISNYNMQKLFDANDLDYDHSTVIRRVISANGKSRAFINDIPVNLNILKGVSERLIDIHSQHQNLLLDNSDFQLNIIDTVAQTAKTLEQYKKIYSEYRQCNKQLNDLKEKAEKESDDLEFYQFQFNQLEELNPDSNEFTELESEIKELEHSEDIKAALQTGAMAISDEESTVISGIKASINSLDKIVQYNKEYEDIHNRLSSTLIEVNDISNELTSIAESFEVNPERTAYVTERLNGYYTLLQKHKADTINDLLNIKDDLDNKIQNISNFDFDIEQLTKKLDDLTFKLTEKADLLTTKRSSQFKKVEKHICTLLNGLGMPNARFSITNDRLTLFNAHGLDNIKFLFNANKQGDMQDIGRVASGGEMSRLMLSLKSLLANSKQFPTLLFDEIDTGISGDIADKMGSIIKTMSDETQIINITHLPQIASKGLTHLKVYKEDTKNTTNTKIKTLSKEERITEIAKMLSGEQLSEAAVSNAKELLTTN